jgi:hypothetical protein
MPSPVSDRIRAIFIRYYEKAAFERFDRLRDFAQTYLDVAFPADSYDTHIDILKLSALVDSYFLDEIRFKEYHFVGRGSASGEKFNDDAFFGAGYADAVHKDKHLSASKIAAFTAKWILKYAPLTIVPHSEPDNLSDDDKDRVLAANARLALGFALQCANRRSGDFESALIADIIYHFRYRDYDERSFILIFEQMFRGPFSAQPQSGDSATGTSGR